MKIKPEVSSAKRTDLTSDGKITQVPIVTTSESESTVMVKDGVTVIIGGLKKEENSQTVKSVPGFADIPVLGALFRNKYKELASSEVVILLTPHIISGESSYANFSEMQIKDGALVRMVKGNIVTERIVNPVEINVSKLNRFEYYKLVSDRVRATVLTSAQKGAEGRVEVAFTLDS